LYRLKRLRIRHLLGYLLLGLLLPLVFGIANAQTDSATTETPTQEVIEDYKSEIKVRQDGRLEVTETITVFNTEGGDIKRGIYRYFPNPDFQVTLVKRDGDRAIYRTEVNGGRKRINIRKKDVYLDPGSYTYQIQYLTDQQIEDKGSQDQLYWNVTGQNWAFPIQRVEAEVILPEEIPSDEITLNAFTSYEGEKGQSYQANLEGNNASFTTTRTLKEREGLSVVVNFPAGFVKSTESVDRSTSANDGSSSLPKFEVIVLGLLFLLLWIGFCSWLFWKKPKVYPNSINDRPTLSSEPPRNLSPTMISYLYQWGKTPSLMVPLISLATKGKIQINEVKGSLGFGKEYKISLKSNPNSNSSELAPEEVTILNTWNHFLKQGNEIELNSNTPLLKEAFENLENSLERQSEKLGYFPKKGWAEALSVLGYIGFLSLFFVIVNDLSYFFSIMVIFLLSTAIFSSLLSAPNLEGRQLIDQIQGFRKYLSDGFRHQGDSSREQFEYYLPYAVALGVEKEWIRGIENLSYQPVWYSPKTASTVTAFALVTALSNDFASALSSSGGDGGVGVAGAGGAGGAGGGGGGAGGGGGGGGGGGA